VDTNNKVLRELVERTNAIPTHLKTNPPFKIQDDDCTKRCSIYNPHSPISLDMHIHPSHRFLFSQNPHPYVLWPPARNMRLYSLYLDGAVHQDIVARTPVPSSHGWLLFTFPMSFFLHLTCTTVSFGYALSSISWLSFFSYPSPCFLLALILLI